MAKPAPPLPFDPTTIEIPSALKFLVLWSRGKGLAGAQVPVAIEVADHLRTACEQMLTTLREREARPYDPDMQLEAEEFLAISDEELVSASPVGIALFQSLPIQLLSARELQAKPLALYAVVIGEGSDQRAFVKKVIRQVVAKPGRFFTALGDTLRRLETGVLELNESFDLIVSPGGVIAADQDVFEGLFKDAQVLQERIPDWAQSIAEHLPLQDGVVERLVVRSQRDSRLRRRLRAIHERGHLHAVPLEVLRQYIADTGLEADISFHDGKLDLPDDQFFHLMYLLNEDFFNGGLTNEKFRSDRKSPRS